MGRSAETDPTDEGMSKGVGEPNQGRRTKMNINSDRYGRWKEKISVQEYMWPAPSCVTYPAAVTGGLPRISDTASRTALFELDRIGSRSKDKVD